MAVERCGVSEFWLYKWMNEFDVRTEAEVYRFLRPGHPLAARLLEIAESVEDEALEPLNHSGEAILAGRGIDLSGELDCCHNVCQTTQVDALFSRALHYFDEIVVSGPPADIFAHAMKGNEETALRNIAHHVIALLYIRKIGADDYLTFVQKPPACTLHYEFHAEEAGLSGVIEQAEPWIDRLAADGVVRSLRHHEHHWDFQISHPELEHAVWGAVAEGPNGDPPSKREMADFACSLYVSHLVSDVGAAHELQVPLGASVRLHEDLLSSGASSKPKAGDVAFDMRLPVMTEFSIADVIKFRLDEYQHFEVFKSALVAAIDERLNSDLSSGEIARAISRDILDPALADLDNRFQIARKSLARKAATSVVVGGLFTTVGMLVAPPLALATGVGTVLGSVGAAHKYIDDKGGIEAADMYWLWNLRRKSEHAH
jgi:hypothetical protein